MKKILLLLAATAVLTVFGTPAASAHEARYSPGYYSYHRGYVAPRYVYSAPRYVTTSYYSYRPVVRPVYRHNDYWHDHYYRNSYSRCHYYGGRHHYSYQPRTSFHIGFSFIR